MFVLKTVVFILVPRNVNVSLKSARVKCSQKNHKGPEHRKQQGRGPDYIAPGCQGLGINKGSSRRKTEKKCEGLLFFIGVFIHVQCLRYDFNSRHVLRV